MVMYIISRRHRDIWLYRKSFATKESCQKRSSMQRCMVLEMQRAVFGSIEMEEITDALEQHLRLIEDMESESEHAAMRCKTEISAIHGHILTVFIACQQIRFLFHSQLGSTTATFGEADLTNFLTIMG